MYKTKQYYVKNSNHIHSWPHDKNGFFLSGIQVRRFAHQTVLSHNPQIYALFFTQPFSNNPHNC